MYISHKNSSILLPRIRKTQFVISISCIPYRIYDVSAELDLNFSEQIFRKLHVNKNYWLLLGIIHWWLNKRNSHLQIICELEQNDTFVEALKMRFKLLFRMAQSIIIICLDGKVKMKNQLEWMVLLHAHGGSEMHTHQNDWHRWSSWNREMM